MAWSSRTQAKAARAKLNPEKKLWNVKYGNIVGTTLEKHIQVDEKDTHVECNYLPVDASIY